MMFPTPSLLLMLLPLLWLPSRVAGQKSELCVAYESSYHIEKGCECLVFESFGGSHGIFTSPNFPLKYPAMTSCILYTFIGDANETVEVSFEHFHLPPPYEDSCSDFLRLYLDLERPEMSNEMTSNFELCGSLSSVDKSYFSTNRSLIMEFHSESEQPGDVFSGFRARYRFLEKSDFDMKEGVQRWSSGCVYEFRSTALPSRSRSFFSPGFPHPPSTSCRYFFHGTPDEQVILNFTSIQLSSTDLKCSNEFRSTDRQTAMITIRDGIFDSAKVLRRFCGSLKATDEAVVKSSEENIFVDFTIAFRASFQGFAGNFRFEKRKIETVTPTLHVVTFNQINKLAHEQLAQNSPNSANSKNFFMENLFSPISRSSCNQSISGDSTERGEISSPGYPRSHPWSQTCKFILVGQQHQQIQLTFIDFDLKRNASQAHPGSQDCRDQDSLTISLSTSMSPFDELGVFCGDVKPPSVMAVRSSLILVMKGGSDQNSESFRGFKAKFSFTSDFGIGSGNQVIFGECSFSYNSSKAQNGSFHSPNFPGLYPRNAMCHYKFYARINERVETLFSYLDVDGIIPFCGPETLSDSIELSNFDVPLSDRKLLPLCGSNRDAPKRQHRYLSDGSFFRVTFKSNDRYDATGFRASYRFFPKHKDDRIPVGLSMKSDSHGTTHNALTSCILLALSSKPIIDKTFLWLFS